MTIQTTYNSISRIAWAEMVRKSPTGNWFQTPEAYDFYASQPELFKPFVVALSGESGLRGVCVGYITVEPNPIKQFLTRRAIILGGPALADDATDEEITALLEAVKKEASLRLPPGGKRDTAQEPSHLGSFKGRLCSLLLRVKSYARLSVLRTVIEPLSGVGSPIYIETRNFNDYSPWRNAFEHCGDHPRRRPLLPFRWKDAPGFKYQPHLNFHVDCTNADEMWSRMSETRRKQIRRAQRADVTISNAQSEEEICEWYAILKRMYKTRVKTPLFPVSFFLEAYRQSVATYLMVRYEGQIIGGSMIVVDGGCVYEWFECGRDVEYEKQYPSVMATYAGMAYAAEHGIARCDFMGAGVPGVPYGVRDFKERFGGKMVEHGRFLYIAKPILYRIGALGVKIMKGL